ncbi:MAG: hypothetical protein HF962_09460 [Sulfurovum sp.]|nr:hypothetical protein [Sulfurovum sp.]
MKKIILLLSLLSFFALQLHAKSVFKRYPIKSGMILYDINITGTSTGLTTQTVGISRLVFDDWGAKELREDDYTEVQQGDFDDKRTRRTMSMMDYGTIYTVDFDENVTYQTRDRNIDMAIAQGADMSNESLEILKDMNATNIGTETIAGYTCDIWQTKDQSICIYKGIPLKITVTAPGFISSRTAQAAILDKAISNSEFTLPGFAVMVDKGYTSNLSASVNTADYMAAIDDLQQKMKTMGVNLNDANISLTKEQEIVVINTLGARYLAKQKRLLPKLMVVLKGARDCINHSENANAASDCIKPVNRISEELGDQTSHYDFSNWDKGKRETTVKDIDKEIKDLNVTIDCVKKYNKTTDVIECTEGSLEPKI